MSEQTKVDVLAVMDRPKPQPVDVLAVYGGTTQAEARAADIERRLARAERCAPTHFSMADREDRQEAAAIRAALARVGGAL